MSEKFELPKEFSDKLLAKITADDAPIALDAADRNTFLKSAIAEKSASISAQLEALKQVHKASRLAALREAHEIASGRFVDPVWHEFFRRGANTVAHDIQDLITKAETNDAG